MGHVDWHLLASNAECRRPPALRSGNSSVVPRKSDAWGWNPNCFQLTVMTCISRDVSSTSFALLCAMLAIAAFVPVARCQEVPGTDATPPDTGGNAVRSEASQAQSRHILGLIPNYRTFPTLQNYKPLSIREKFKIASEDSLDRGTFAMAAAFGGLGQLTNSNKSFGQGAAGFGKYFGASYGDLMIGNYITEGVFPAILHQDPRYFRRGTGSGGSRFLYALSRVVRTQRDSGGSQFNCSEWLGNASAVAISNAYYPNQRSAGNAVGKLGMQVGVDAIGNVLKEFWPDLQRKFSKKPKH